MRLKTYVLAGFIASLCMLSGCKGQGDGADTRQPANPNQEPGRNPGNQEPGRGPENEEPTRETNTTEPPAGLHFTRLTFEEKLDLDKHKKISAIGRDGDGKYIYFGDSEINNKVFLFEREANPFAVQEIPTCVLNAGKCAAHLDGGKNGALYNAAYEGVRGIFSPDQTQVIKIVPGSGNKAIVALTGLVSSQYYVWPGSFSLTGKTKIAVGGILQLDSDKVAGVWGVTEESLNAKVNGKEVASLTTIGGTWVGFPKDEASKGAYRVFDERPAKAHEIQVDNQNKIVIAAVGHDGTLFRALSDGSIRRLVNAESNLDNPAAEEQTLVTDPALFKHVTALAVVESQLLVGLSAASGGGIALVDLSDPSFSVTAPDNALAGMSVKHMAQSQDQKSVWITTEGQGIIHYSAASGFSFISNRAPKNRAQENNKLELDSSRIDDAQREGFSLDNAVIGTVNISNNLYVATKDNGIFKFIIEEVK